ncbi:unnamed protein product [Caenorhabditis sp. 36 PRJEB53466]|nr:unnamed protein product [Caenorhabditis sp. 36 PRJEB53466]
MTITSYSMYLLIFHTPVQMKEMKWYLMNLACWTRALDLMYSLFVVPYFFIPTIVVLPVGLFSMIGLWVQVQLIMLVVILVGLGSAVIMIFENRFNAIAPPCFRFKIGNRKLYHSCMFVISFTLLISSFLKLEDQTTAKIGYLKFFTCPIPEYHTSAFSFKPVSVPLLITTVLLFSLLILAQVVFFGCSSFYFLYTMKKGTMSQATRKLQRKFFLTAWLQLLTHLSVIVIPMGYTFFSFMLSYRNQILVNLSTIIITLHGTITSISTVAINRPFRNRVKQWFIPKKFRNRRSSTKMNLLTYDHYDYLDVSSYLYDSPRDLIDGSSPTTPDDMQTLFRDNLVGMLDGRKRSSYDDLVSYFHPDVKIYSCFAAGIDRNLTEGQFHHLIAYMAGYYQHFHDIRSQITLKTDGFLSGLLRYNASTADGKYNLGKWTYKASFDKHKQKYNIYEIVFQKGCFGVPLREPTEPIEEVDAFIERVRRKLETDLFLPDGREQTLQDFEEFGDLFTDDAITVVCDEPMMNIREFIQYLATRYHHIRKYKDHEYSHVKFDQHFEITFSVTWTAANTSEFRDTYVFRVKKARDFFAELNDSFWKWMVYWVTKKCTIDVTQYLTIVTGSNHMMEVNKRFCGMINGENWDVYQSFLDLFDPNATSWRTCISPKKRNYSEIKEHMESVTAQYAKCYVQEVKIRNMTNYDFLIKFVLSRVKDVQGQEDMDVGFAGYMDPKFHNIRLTKMTFECEDFEEK